MLRNIEWIVRQLGSWLVPVIIGVLACLLVTGGPMLWPGNVKWLMHSDLAQSYLGWAFYRQGPWGWPPGADPLYGVGQHASVYYSDSIPLLALLFKPFASWLPTPFQYFGLWVLACFVLQACFAWRLLELATPSRLVRSLGILLFVMAPPMLFRLGGHMALVGHWIVLAAIYLCLRPSQQRQIVYWAMLLMVAISVHAYLFAIAGAIWVADMIQRYWIAPRDGVRTLMAGLRRCAPEVCVVGVVTLFAAWLAGMFMMPAQAMQAGGYGIDKMNVLAPINGAGWSWIGLNLPQAPGEYEGFNYLGLGGIVLILSAILMRAICRDVANQHPMPRPLLAVAVLLAVAAVTCNVGFGVMQWHIPLPPKVWGMLSHSPLQSTGRLFWVAYYLLLVAAIFVVARVLSTRGQVLLLSGVVLLQCLDLYPGVRGFHSLLVDRASGTTPLGLHGAFWDAAGNRYGMLRKLPLGRTDGWEQLALYANSHRMSIDSVQMARIDLDRVLTLYNQGQMALLSNQLDPKALYILDDRELGVARVATLPKDVALFRLDGLNVLAPGWLDPLPSNAIDLRHAGPVSASFGLPFASDFVVGSAGRLLLGEGWNGTDSAEEVTSLSYMASLFVPGGDDAGRTVRVALNLHRSSVGKSMAQQLEVWFDGQRIGACRLDDDSCRHLAFDVPAAKQAGYFRKLELRSNQPSAKLRVTLDAIGVQ